MAFVLNADCIGKRYRDRNVLTAASLRVERGSVVGLLGKMGAGKSTLLRVCAGLVRPDVGWVRFGAVQYHRPQLHRLATLGLYYLADRGNLANGLTIRRHFEVLDRRFRISEWQDAVTLLQLDDLLEASPLELSLGQRRRAEFGMAVARSPKCLLADELFRGIDPLASELLGEQIRRLASGGCAVVVTGHETTILSAYIDSVVWLTDGTTYELGPQAEAWEHERFRKEYLGIAARE
jgi:ABC-type multidrug transport system ATPase subunit